MLILAEVVAEAGVVISRRRGEGGEGVCGAAYNTCVGSRCEVGGL